MGRITDVIFDALFPRYCLSCKEEGSILCKSCEEKFDDRLTGERAMFAYGNPIIRDLIKTWKYHYDWSAWEALKRLSDVGSTRASALRERIDAITFIPLSKRRFAERGFNQAEEIAKWIGEVRSIPVKNFLERKESVGHQAERTDEERKTAMQQNPFSYNPQPKAQNHKKILLVDDVWTTGATMEAASKALKEGGVEEVFFYTLAKGR